MISYHHLFVQLAALAGTQEGKAAELQAGWNKALKQAEGQRVLDDPKLLKKSIKRDQKAKAKSSKEWAERNRKVEEAKKAKKLQRFTTVTKKKQANRARKIEKRDNKLLRAGFEGRKKGAVNGAK
jgi:hypothetical protein